MNDLRTKLGLAGVHPTIVGLGATLYFLIALILIVGLVVLIIGTIAIPFDVSKSPKEMHTDFLFSVLRLAGLTTVLGAVIALPFTIVRLGLSTQQTKTARDSLFNEKINAATQGLYARRQVTKWTRKEGQKDIWQDDIVQRCAAIDGLEGLAAENRDVVPRIARLLSVYLRELSVEIPAHPAATNRSSKELQQWAKELPKLRSDMEKAAQTLGRLNAMLEKPMKNGEIDLRDANLQNADLNNLDFRNARLSGTRLQGADLFQSQLQEANLALAQLQGARLDFTQLQRANLCSAELQGADLGGADLQGAVLRDAQLQGADLGQTQLQAADLRNARLQRADLWTAELGGTNLRDAQLQGAQLLGAQFDDKTTWNAAILKGAAFKVADLTNIPQILMHLEDLFCDASVELPNGIGPKHAAWPSHWPRENLELRDFITKWREWQKTLPKGWDKDIPKD